MSVRLLFALTVTTHITRTLARRMVTTVLAGFPAGYSSEPARGITAGSTEATDSTAGLATVMVAGAMDMDITATDLALPDTERLAEGSEVVKRAAVAATVAEVSTVEAVTAAVTGKFHT
ncbi:MAG: hypothetical protein WB630_24995 [Candidatus Acidiferrales bacterium]